MYTKYMEEKDKKRFKFCKATSYVESGEGDCDPSFGDDEDCDSLSEDEYFDDLHERSELAASEGEEEDLAEYGMHYCEDD